MASWVLWCASLASSHVVCKRSDELAFRCAWLGDSENSTAKTAVGETKLSVIKRFEPGSAYVWCTCPETAASHFTMAWFVGREWVAKIDGTDGELIEESLDIRDGWEARVKTHRGLLYLKKLNESASYCLRCVCTSGTRQFVSDAQCVRLADLQPGTAPHKRDWRFSIVAACFAVAGAFVVAAALLTHLGFRDDASESDILELIRDPISVLNLTIIHHDSPDPVDLDAPPPSPIVERGRDTSRSRRNTFEGRESDLPVDVAVRNSI